MINSFEGRVLFLELNCVYRLRYQFISRALKDPNLVMMHLVRILTVELFQPLVFYSTTDISAISQPFTTTGGARYVQDKFLGILNLILIGSAYDLRVYRYSLTY